MKRTLLFTAVCALLFSANAQTNSQPTKFKGADVDPDQVAQSGIPVNKALWDVQFSFNSTAEAGFNGQAGIALFNNEIWVSRWASDTIFKFTTSGSLITTLVIPGLSGTRSITTDGTYLYIGNNTTTIYRVDPASATLAPPHITSTAWFNSRFLTYDPTLDGGNGGFWTGNFNTDIVGLNMSGAVIATITQGTHGQASVYGGAVDNVTAGGPFLWIYSQIGANSCQMTAIQLPTGTPVLSYNYDTYPDFSGMYSLTSGLAGGIFLTTDFSPGTTSLLGVCQGSPDNVIFAYHIDPTTGLSELESGDKELVKITDLMGRETEYKAGQPLIYVYSDGSTEKVFSLQE